MNFELMPVEIKVQVGSKVESGKLGRFTGHRFKVGQEGVWVKHVGKRLTTTQNL